MQVVGKCAHLTHLSIGEEEGNRKGLPPEMRRLAGLRGLSSSLRALHIDQLFLSQRESPVLLKLVMGLPRLLWLCAHPEILVHHRTFHSRICMHPHLHACFVSIRPSSRAVLRLYSSPPSAWLVDQPTTGFLIEFSSIFSAQVTRLIRNASNTAA